MSMKKKLKKRNPKTWKWKSNTAWEMRYSMKEDSWGPEMNIVSFPWRQCTQSNPGVSMDTSRRPDWAAQSDLLFPWTQSYWGPRRFHVYDLHSLIGGPIRYHGYHLHTPASFPTHPATILQTYNDVVYSCCMNW